MYTWILDFFTVFLKNRNISSKIKRSKVTEYAALKTDGSYITFKSETAPKYIFYAKK